jgi:fructose transport system ATP-binding protein
MSDVILKTEGLTKHYGGVHALENANFELRMGEHVAIMGDNGAGKSTFVRQITGVEQPTRGKIVFNGTEMSFRGPLDAREAGIETVFQNLALADDLDVPSNLFLGREKILFNLGPFSILARKAMREATRKALERTAVKIPNLSNTIRNMSGGQRQCVAIARTATFASKLIIMDEPTAALGVQETAQVENIVKTLKANGEPLILISPTCARSSISRTGSWSSGADALWRICARKRPAARTSSLTSPAPRPEPNSPTPPEPATPADRRLPSGNRQGRDHRPVSPAPAPQGVSSSSFRNCSSMTVLASAMRPSSTIRQASARGNSRTSMSSPSWGWPPPAPIRFVAS